MKFQIAVCLTAAFGCSLAYSAGGGSSIYVTTQHNDYSRSGLNPVETKLTVLAVSGQDPNHSEGFGKLFQFTLDQSGEQVYAQPLYAGGVKIGETTHNVVYIASELNSVYAFDADEAGSALGGTLTGGALWRVNLGTPVLCADIYGCNRDLLPDIGITSTPVIDVARNTIYVVAETAVGTQQSQCETLCTARFTLHALNMSTGAEEFGGPVTIGGSVAGIGGNAESPSVQDFVSNGRLTFNAWQHWQRAGLLLLNGTIYIAFAGHQDTNAPYTYHGWIFGYDEKTLRLNAIRCTTPNGQQGGVWQGGEALSADSAGNVYVTTGNGDLDNAVGNYSQSVMKLNSLNGLAEEDYFAPDDWAVTTPADADLGATGALVIPGTSPPLVLVGGKTGNLYLVDSANMGEYSTTANNVVQTWATSWTMGAGHVFFNSTLYTWGRFSYLYSFAFNNANAVAPYTKCVSPYTAANCPFNSSPTAQSSVYAASGYQNEPAMSVSANAPCPVITSTCTTAPVAGTGIIWATYSISGTSNGSPVPGYFRAFNASSLALIWDSQANYSRDNSGDWAKCSPPTVANGKVYVSSFDGVINVYGLLN